MAAQFSPAEMGSYDRLYTTCTGSLPAQPLLRALVVCSNRAPDPCWGVDCGQHGRCSGGACHCAAGFTGSHCEVNSGPPEGWYAGGLSESCDVACGNNGLACTEENLFLHNSDVTTTSGTMQIIARVGEHTNAASCYSTYSRNSDVPCFSHTQGSHGRSTADCYRSAENRPLDTFRCSSAAGSDKYRLCYCSRR